MPGKPIKDTCPGCGGNGGTHNDWFPELGAWDEWPCGTHRGIDKFSGQRIAYLSKTCQRIRDLQKQLSDALRSQGKEGAP